jgi:lipopolysaccharide export system protein LptA
MSRLPIAFALAACAVPAMAAAQTPAAKPQPRHDSNAPLDWSADRIEVQDRDHKANLVGNVRVTQQEMTLTSDRMTALYTGSIAGSQQGGAQGGDGNPKVQRLDANGHVVVTRPTEIARGNYGIYDLNTKLITLIGNVSLDRNGSVVRGGRLVINQNTNQAMMDGSAVSGGGAGKGGRVSGRFIVDQNDKGGSASTPAPATKR